MAEKDVVDALKGLERQCDRIANALELWIRLMTGMIGMSFGPTPPPSKTTPPTKKEKCEFETVEMRVSGNKATRTRRQSSPIPQPLSPPTLKADMDHYKLDPEHLDHDECTAVLKWLLHDYRQEKPYGDDPSKELLWKRYLKLSEEGKREILIAAGVLGA